MNTEINTQELPAEKIENKRLLALDAVRGLAVIGMYIQHFASNARNSFVSGNTMILFMLCSGISYALMTKRMLLDHSEDKRMNTRILARAVFIDFAGYLLILLNGPFAVVLTAYAMLYLLARPFVRVPAKKLFIMAGAAFFICPPLMLIGQSLFENAALLSDIAGGPLSALAWMPVFLVGMGIGRLDLNKTDNFMRFILAGVLILIPTKLVETFVMPGISQAYMEWSSLHQSVNEVDIFAMWPKNTQPVLWHYLFISMPQGGSTCELLAGTGGSLIILGVFCLIGAKYKKLLKPLCNVGKLSLTLYVIQIAAGWLLCLINTDWTNALLDLGSIPLGDVIVAVFVILLSYLLVKAKISPFENMMRKFEKNFI